MHLGDILLLAGGLILYVWLTALLWFSKAHRRFPIFFTYNVYAIAVILLRATVLKHPRTYFYAFWWSELGVLLLSIAAMHEAFQSVFEGFYLLKGFRWVYFGGIVSVLAVSVTNSIFNRPVQMHPLLRIILDIATPTNCIQAAIFGLFYLLVKLLNVSFRRYSFGIVLGFGISAMGTLIPLAARSAFGKKLEIFAVYAPSVSYYITLGIWLIAFLGSEREGHDLDLSPEQMADEVRQYTRILKGFFSKTHES